MIESVFSGLGAACDTADDVVTFGPAPSADLWRCHQSSPAAFSSSALEEGERNLLPQPATHTHTHTTQHEHTQ